MVEELKEPAMRNTSNSESACSQLSDLEHLTRRAGWGGFRVAPGHLAAAVAASG